MKLVKRATVRCAGANILTFSELQSAFYEIANMLKERPIGIKPGYYINMGFYLCANDVLLERSSVGAPARFYSTVAYFKVKQNSINLLIQSF